MARFQPTWSEDPGAKLPFKPIYWLVFLLVVLTYFCINEISSSEIAEAHPLARKAALIVFSGEVLGVAAGLVCVFLLDKLNTAKCNYTESNAKAIGSTNSYEGIFIAFVTFIISIYVICYLLAALNFAQSAEADEWPVSKYVAGITGGTIFLLAFFAVKYAAHVRMTRLLELALEKRPDDRPLIAGLRKVVFRGDQLYEPAGNIFVTLGITATFLGLAVGLVILDIPALFGGNLDDTVVNGAAEGSDAMADPEAVRRQAVASLRSFVGCMGLALGVSMLGVMTALAAQGLRARGAASPTEELLAEAGSAMERILVAEAEAAAAAAAAEAKAARAEKRAKARKAARPDKAAPPEAPRPAVSAGSGNDPLPMGSGLVTILPSETPPLNSAAVTNGPAKQGTALDPGSTKGSEND